MQYVCHVVNHQYIGQVYDPMGIPSYMYGHQTSRVWTVTHTDIYYPFSLMQISL